MDLENKMARLGITGNVYKVYLAAVEMGEVPVSELAARAGLPRTTAYDAVARLEEEGLVEVRGAGRKRSVVAYDPSVLLEYVEARRQMVTEMLPQLRSLYNHALGKPHIRFYEGEEGIRTVLWESLNCRSGQMRAIFSMSELAAVPGLEEINHYAAERIQRGIHMKVIRSRDRDLADIWPNSEGELRELRFAPDDVPLSMTVFIYDNCVALISSKRENYGLLIESEEFAALQKTMFDAIWHMSQPGPPA